MNKKYIYLVFSKTGTMFSHLISLCTHEQYAHVSLSLDGNFTTMYSFGRKIPAKMLPAGFIEENLYDGVFAMFPQSKCLIYKVEVNEDQFNIINKELSVFIKNKDVYRYNILGTSLAYINKPRKRQNHYFCSQFVSEILIKSGVFKTSKSPETVMPLDLLNIENKIFIYEGYINDLKFLVHSLPSPI